MTAQKQSQQAKTKAVRQHPEEDEQRALFEWVNWVSGKYPELELLFHIPNGGKRNKLEAIRLKQEGVKAGVPDLFLPVPRGGYHGLFIELKAGKGVATFLQKEWIARLEKQGYCAKLLVGWEAAAAAIMDYLRKDREARDHFKSTEPEQLALNVDPDTGGIVGESDQGVCERQNEERGYSK